MTERNFKELMSQIRFNADGKLAERLELSRDHFRLLEDNIQRMIGCKQERDRPECSNEQFFTYYDVI